MSLGELKMDFLLSVQTNQYDKAFGIGRQILQAHPGDQLISKFWKFLQDHKEEMKQIDSENIEQIDRIVQSDSGDSDSECPSDFSVDSSDDEPQAMEPIVCETLKGKAGMLTKAKDCKKSCSTLPRKK